MLSLFVYNRDNKKAESLNEKCLAHIEKSGRQLEKNGCFCDPAKIFSVIRTWDNTSLYMLSKDSKLLRMSEAIRFSNDGNYIVLILQNAEEMFEAVTPSIRPSGILLENSDESRIAGLIDEIYADYSRMNRMADSDVLCFRSHNISYKVSYNTIITIEVQKKKVIVNTEAQMFEFYDSLDNIVQYVPDYFIRIHRSIILNTNFISMVNYSERNIKLKDGNMLFFSRSYKDEIKKYLGNTLKENYF